MSTRKDVIETAHERRIDEIELGIPPTPRLGEFWRKGEYEEAVERMRERTDKLRRARKHGKVR